MNVRPRTVGQRWTLGALFAVAVIVFADMYLAQPILPVFSKEFSIGPATAGLAVSVVVLVIALASLAIGPLSDRVGRKRIMVLGSTLLAVPTLLCALAPSFNWLLVFRALQGLCIPGLTAVAVAYLGDILAPAVLGSAVGGWIAANVAGGLIGRVLSGVLTDLFGWRVVFGLFATVTLCGGLLLALLLPVDAQRESDGWLQSYRGMFAHFLNRQLVGGFLIGGSLFFGFIGLFTYLPYYLTGAPFNVPSRLVSFAYVTYIAGVVASPIAGRLSARVPRRLLIGIGLVMAMIGASITLVPSVAVIIGSLLLVCAGMFAAQAVAPAFVNVTAERAKGGAGALYLLFYYLGGTLGGVLPGLAWQSNGWVGVVVICLSAFLVALLANVLLCGKPTVR